MALAESDQGEGKIEEKAFESTKCLVRTSRLYAVSGCLFPDARLEGATRFNNG